MRMRLVLLAVLAAALLAPAALAAPLPEAPNCPIFPTSNVWNKPIGSLPKHPRSKEIVKAIGADRYVHADFGSGLWDGGPIGIPVTVVDSSEPTSFVDFLYDATKGTWRGHADQSGDPRLTIPAQIYAGDDGPGGAWVSRGYLDDECDGLPCCIRPAHLAIV